MTLEDYLECRRRVIELDPEAFARSGEKLPPIDATDFALRVAYVVLNAGMRWSVARVIWVRLQLSLIETGTVGDTFRHPRKRAAIDEIMRERDEKFEAFRLAWAAGPDKVIEFCASLSFIGDVTKFHLAKNLGVDCAKPDIWLERIARESGESVETMCRRLADASGDRVATVDYVIWKAATSGARAPT